MTKEVVYLYGMKFRGFSPGCQPLTGLRFVNDDIMAEYHNILAYNRVLTKQEEDQYELDYIGSRCVTGATHECKTVSE